MQHIPGSVKNDCDYQAELAIKDVYLNHEVMHGSNLKLPEPHPTNHIDEGRGGPDKTGFSVTLSTTVAEQNAKYKALNAGGTATINYYTINIAPEEICIYQQQDSSFPDFRKTEYDSIDDNEQAHRYLLDMGIKALLVSGSGNDGSFRIQDTDCLTFVRSSAVPV